MARKPRTHETASLEVVAPRMVIRPQARRLEAEKSILYGLVVIWSGCGQVARGIIEWLRALAG